MDLNQDWQRYKHFSNSNKDNSFYIDFKQFCKYFKGVCINYTNSKIKKCTTSFTFKDNTYNAWELEIQNSGPVIIEIQQLDKIFSDSKYKYIDFRVYIIELRKDNPRNVVYKAFFLKSKRDSFIEEVLQAGSYLIVVEPHSEYIVVQRNFVLNFWYMQDNKAILQNEPIIYNKRRFVDALCNLAILKGKRETIRTTIKTDQLSRYRLQSKK